MISLFAWPESAKVGTRIPRDRLFRAAGGSKAIRALYEEQVERVDWAFKLFERSVNLPSRDDVTEIEVIRIAAKRDGIEDRVLAHLDRALPHPTYFEITRAGADGKEIQVAAAFKRRSDADRAKVVVLEHWRSPWEPDTTVREPLPPAITLDGLYAELLRSLWPSGTRLGESLRSQAERLSKAAAQARTADRLEQLVRREKVFARQVELNRELRLARAAYKEMID